ncbi:sugar ABC transporter substrate-binding protein [Clostridia bacterium]|nr:sugar ABC transporter substrate-binding protein [Clostridia bacterium]
MKRSLAVLISLALVCICGFASVGTAEGSGYPLDTDTTLRVWFADIAISGTYTSQAEALMFQKIEELTGVTVEWIAPPASSDADTAYNLMMASSDLPDIIWSKHIVNNALTYLDDGVIIDLTDYLTEEYMPNLMAVYEENPTYALATRTDDGRIYGTPSVVQATSWQGPWMRTDWLEAVRLASPETIDDWTAVLTAFKSQYNAAFSTPKLENDVFLGAYGLPKFNQNNGFFQKDGKIQYVADSDGYKAYLTQLNEWYKAGLIDPDFMTNDETAVVNKAANGETGAISGFQVTGAHIKTAQGVYGTDGNWKPIAYPKLVGGERSLVEMGLDVIGMANAITTQCKDVGVAVRFLDWMYSREGINTFNFGIEGISFVYDENGNPQYTDEFLNGPEGMVEYARRYTAVVGNAPSIKSAEAGNARNDAASNEAEAVWKSDWTNADWAEIVLPILGATEEENEQTTDAIAALNTYVKEATYSFVTGERSLDTWDAYLAELNKIGLERVKTIRQAQLDRVNAR